MRAALFLDRDGVLNDLVPDPVTGRPESPLHPQDVRLLPGVAVAIERARTAGYLIVGVSNQPAAAKGAVVLEQLREVQTRVEELLQSEGVHLDAMYICFHHPNGVVPELSGECPCRKPAPGMLLDAARDLGLELDASWLVGDTDADIGAASAAGVRAVSAEHPGSAHKRVSPARPEFTAADLPAAVSIILDHPSR